MSMRGLHMVKGAPWYAAFRAELLRFPAGKHDDQVDALGLIGQLLDTATSPALKMRRFGVVRGGRESWMGS